MIIAIVITILIGALCGWIASKLLKGKGFGFWINCLIGIVGSWLGGWIFKTLGITLVSGLVGDIIVSVIGAVVLLWIISLFRRK